MEDIGGSDVEGVSLTGVEISEFERTEAGEAEGQLKFSRLVGVEETAARDGVECPQKRMRLIQNSDDFVRRFQRWRDNMGEEFGTEVGEVVEGVAVAGLGKVDEPEKTTGADKNVFHIEVAMQGGLCAYDSFVEESGQF